AAASVDALSSRRSPPPNRAAAAALACAASAAPCTSVVTASASALWAARLYGASAVCCSTSSISARERNVKIRSRSPTLSSSTLSQNWWKAYGDIISGSSHSAPASVLPYFVPSELVPKGGANACAL